MAGKESWFHCTTHTYGAWLYGDARGFRTRHHREHVDGDYKKPPPPGKYDEQLQRSRRLLKQEPVVIPRELREVVAKAMVERLQRCGAEVLCLSAGGQHIHLLAKMPGGPVPREWVGRAKMHTTFVLRGHGWEGELWATRSKINPIKDRDHQLNTFRYILRHAAEGAWVWDFRDYKSESPGPAGPGLSDTMNPTDLLRELVRLPSVNPMGRTDIRADLTHESRVTAFLEAQLRSLGVPVERQPVAPGRDNVLAHFRPPNAPHALLWEAHQDTVPVDGMTIDPFAADVRDGKLFGRGACDVKAGIAVMLAAFARLVRENPLGASAVTVAFTVDEEHTFLGAQELAKTARADFAVVAEPTGLDLVTAHKGVVRWVLSTHGRACHSSRPEQGENAVYKMARVLTAIEEYADRLRASKSDPRLGPPTISVGRIAGGVSPNTVPDACRIDIDRRLLPGESADAAEADLLAALAGLDVRFERTLDCPPLPPTAEGHPLLARLAAVIGSPKVMAVPYGTDASTLALAGIPSVVFGPGDIAQAHTKDEWVELAQVDAAADILFRFAAGRS